MKLRTTSITLAIALSGFAGTALAANAAPTQPTAEYAAVSECLRGSVAPSKICGPFDALLTKDFTPREIGMVSEWDASEPEYMFDKIEALHHRLEVVMEHYIEQQDAMHEQVATK